MGIAMDDRQDEIDWSRAKPRDIPPEQWARYLGYLEEIFVACGMPLATPGMRRTPERHLKALLDATSGYEGDAKLITAFPTECRGGPDCKVSQVVEGPIPFHALCEHHALPFSGQAFVGYVAHDNILGLSKLTRIVRLFARRFTVQERIGREVVELIERILQPQGVAVHLRAVHLCTQMRGVRDQESATSTTHWRGNYESDAGLRSEFLRMAGSWTRP
jgi:GTP cyclohydrolase IA